MHYFPQRGFRAEEWMQVEFRMNKGGGGVAEVSKLLGSKRNVFEPVSL